MTFRQYENVKELENICKMCGSKRVRQTSSYISVAEWQNKDSGKFTAEVSEDGSAFYCGVFCKAHFNLIEIAVIEDRHGQGIGKQAINRLKQRCLERGIHTIRLRTAISETAVDFYYKQGGEIVGLKEEDYVMEIKI